MRIAFFNSIATWGGGEKWHYDASVSFANAGHDVYFFGAPQGIIANKLKDNKDVKFIPIQLSNTSFLNPIKLLKLKKTFKNLKLNVLVINHPGDLKIAAHAAHLAKIPHIMYRRGSAIPIKDRLLNRHIFKNWVTDILANSKATKNTITELNPDLFPIDKIKVIYNPIDITEFLERPFTSAIPISNDVLTIGSLGRLAPQKNQFFLIDLSKKLKEQQIPHKIYIGGIGSLQEELLAYSKENNTEDTVVFLGFLDNVKNLLMEIDIFVLPSLWEGFGYVLAEASLCKKPIIAFNCSSNPELVLDNETGYLIPENDIDAAVDKIKILQNPTLRSKLGEQGFNYCSQTFDKNKISEELQRYFIDLA